VQANKAIVGRNAFAHEAGIHQDGILKDRRTYEIMRPEDVGVPRTTMVLGKHSGRHALKARCEALGIAPARHELDDLYRRMITLADRQKTVHDRDLVSLWSAMKRVVALRPAHHNGNGSGNGNGARPAVEALRAEEAPAVEEAGYGYGV
jgi:2-isopropylmalate synthase